MHQYIKVSGTPYERGFQYGSQAKERIYKVIEEYRVLFEKEAFISWDRAYELSKPYRKEIEKYRPDLVEEMKGIADGAGLDFNTILTLNCRSEIMFAKADIAEDACTTIGVPPEASENGHTLLAQNWDWWSMGYGTTVLLEVEQKPFAKAIIISEAGLVGGKGLNDCGIALSMNAMSVKKGKLGVPLQVLLRGALSCKTIPKAIDAIAKANRAGSACVGLAGADGLLLFIEYAPNDLDILLSEGEPCCHSNHWLSLKMNLGPEAKNYSYNSTFIRLDRARRLVKKEDKLSVEKIFEILSDHAGYPDGVCRHDDETLPIYHRHSSVWSMVIDVNEKIIYLTEGTPCKFKPKEYKLY